MGEEGHLRTFKNTAPLLLRLNNYKVIAPFIQNTRYRYSSETKRDRGLKHSPMPLVHLEIYSIYSHRKDLSPLVVFPLKVSKFG